MGASGGDRGNGIVLDASGHLYICGSFSGTTDMDPGPGVYNLTSAGSSDIYVVKFDTSGTLIWAKAMGGPYSDGANAIAIDEVGNVYTTGGFCGTADYDPDAGTFNMTAATTSEHDIYVSKLDADGNFVWAKGIIGGTWWDDGYGIAIDPVGDVVVSGRFYYQGGPRDFDPGPGTYFLTAGHEDIFVLKLDTDGDFIWAVAFGTAPDESRSYSIALDDAGNIFTTGYFRGTVDFDPDTTTYTMTSVGTWNVFYHKMDPDGNLLWVRSLPITTTTYHYDSGYGRKITVDEAGNLLATGRFNGTVDFDPGAGTMELTSNGDFDIYVLKYSGDGDAVWASSVGGPGYDEGFGIHAQPDGGVLVTGTFQIAVDFDPGPDTMSLTSAGAEDMFILQLADAGTYVRAVSMGGTDSDKGFGIESSASGAIYLTGWFAGTADLDPGDGTFAATSAGSTDAFLVKLVEYDATGIAQQEQDAATMSLFPNPASDRVTIGCDADLLGKRAVIEVFDGSGKQVHTEQVSGLKAMQPLALARAWKEGLYLVMLRVEGQAPRSARVMVRP